MTTKVCPVCGISLSERNPLAHSQVHFPPYLDPARSSKQARTDKEALEAGGITKEEFEAKAKEAKE